MGAREATAFVQRESERGHFLGHGVPRHVHGVAELRGVLVLEVALDMPQARVHSRPFLGTEVPEQFRDEPLLERLGGIHEHAKLRVIEHVLKRELNLVTDDEWHAVAGHGVKQAIRGRRIPARCKQYLEFRIPAVALLIPALVVAPVANTTSGSWRRIS